MFVCLVWFSVLGALVRVTERYILSKGEQNNDIKKVSTFPVTSGNTTENEITWDLDEHNNFKVTREVAAITESNTASYFLVHLTMHMEVFKEGVFE